MEEKYFPFSFSLHPPSLARERWCSSVVKDKGKAGVIIESRAAQPRNAFSRKIDREKTDVRESFFSLSEVSRTNSCRPPNPGCDDDVQLSVWRRRRRYPYFSRVLKPREKSRKNCPPSSDFAYVGKSSEVGTQSKGEREVEDFTFPSSLW